MSDYRLKMDGNRLTLPRSVLSHLSDAGEEDIKVLLLLCAGETEKTVPGILGIDRSEVASSVAFWRGAGILQKKCNSGEKSGISEEKQEGSEEKKDAPKETDAPDGRDVTHKDTSKKEKMAEVMTLLPDYSSEEVSRLCEGDRVLRSIFDEAQQVYGKVFNHVELKYIIAMRDHLGLDGEYILMLLQYFRAEKKPLCYVVRTADSLVKDGIDTPLLLEDYIRRRDSMKGTEGLYRDLFGIGSRRLTSYEEKYFSQWNEQKVPFELLKLAFDRTVEKKGTPQKSYINGILSRWMAEGFRTVSDVETAENAQKTSGTGRNGAKSGKKDEGKVNSFDVNDFFNAALERTYGKKG